MSQFTAVLLYAHSLSRASMRTAWPNRQRAMSLAQELADASGSTVLVCHLGKRIPVAPSPVTEADPEVHRD